MTSIGSRRLRSKSFERKLERTAYLFIMPAAILLIVFCIVPMLGSFWVSMQKMGVDLSQAEFVGLDNYTKALSDRRFIQSVGVTLKYTAVEVPLADDYRRAALRSASKKHHPKQAVPQHLLPARGCPPP